MFTVATKPGQTYHSVGWRFEPLFPSSIFMKATSSTTWKLAVVLTGLAFLTGTTLRSTNAPSPADNSAELGLAGPGPASPAPAAAPMPDSNSIPTAVPVPVVPKLSPAAQEVLKLAQSGLSDDVVLAYISGSYVRFGLGSDQIIYLNDLGVGADIIKAMIQRDTALDQTSQPDATQNNPSATDTNAPPDVASQTAPMPTDAPPDYTDDGEEPYGTPDVSSDYFYEALAPYGNWIVVPGYGRCWQPIVCQLNPDWIPYCTQGCWIYTDFGWYWRSDYSWGWAPFHYGRWFRDEHLGWAWRPGRAWAPAWVSWRCSADYCGWAPLPPEARFRAGVGLTWQNHPVAATFDFGLKPAQYTFVPTAHLADRVPDHFRVAQAQTAVVFLQTAAAKRIELKNGHVVNPGAEAEQVAAASQTAIRPVALRNLRLPEFVAHPQERVRTAANAPSFQPSRPGPLAPTRDTAPVHETVPYTPTYVRPAQQQPPLQQRIASPLANPATPAAPRSEVYPDNPAVLAGHQTVSAPSSQAHPFPNMNLAPQQQPAQPIRQYGTAMQQVEVGAQRPAAAESYNRSATVSGYQTTYEPRQEPARNPGGERTIPAPAAPAYRAPEPAPAPRPEPVRIEPAATPRETSTVSHQSESQAQAASQQSSAASGSRSGH
jgi:hypothetical protein